MQTAVPLAAVLLGILWSAPGSAASPGCHKPVCEWDNSYDPYFRKYSKRYFGPGFDWRWFKSQAVAESALIPDVSSSAGAMGLMQILPSTYEEIKRMQPHFTHITEPRWNIAAGIFYDRRLYRKWETPPPGTERLYYTFASYNAGFGRVAKALRKVRPEDRWLSIKPHVPGQTRHYVERIQRLMDATDIAARLPTR